MHSLRLFSAFVIAGLLATATAGQDKPAVTVKLAKLAELQKTIESHKGKVVVVDLWSTT